MLSLRFIGAIALLIAVPPMASGKPKKQSKQITVADIQPQLAVLQRKGSFRSNLCWRRFQSSRRSINRQKWLLLRFKRYPCDANAWRRCHRLRYATSACRAREVRLRFGACFRIHRRLFVIAYRLQQWRRDGIRARCRWKMRIPATFAVPLFSPYPKLSSQ